MGETDQAQIIAALLAVTSLQELGSRVEVVDKGKEIRRIKQQAAKIQAELPTAAVASPHSMA